MYYSPVSKEYLNIQELQSKFNSCIPGNTLNFHGYYKVFSSQKPEISKFQSYALDTPKFNNGKFYESYKVSDIPLEDAKNLLLEENNNLYSNTKNNKSSNIKSSLGFTINCNSEALDSIIKLSFLNQNMYTFITYDNKEIEINKESLNTIIQEISKVQENLFIQKQKYKKQILEANTIKDLESINIVYTLEI